MSGRVGEALAATGKLGFESMRVARSQPIVSVLVALVAAAACLSVLGTTGRTIVAEQQLLGALDESGARIVEVRSVDGVSAIPPDAVQRVAGISGVDWAVGLGRPFDLRPGVNLDLRVPAIRIVGVSPAVVISDGWSEPALYVSRVSATRAGLETGAGSLSMSTGQVLPVQGIFTAAYPLQEMNRFVVIKDDGSPDYLDRLVIEAADSASVPSVAAAIPDALGDHGTAGTTISEPRALLDARQVVEGRIGEYGRTVVLGVLSGALVLCGLTVFSGVVARRRDFGRRRALGATRTQLLVLVVGQSLWPALAGVAVGTAVGLAVLAADINQLPPWGFPAGVAILVAMAVMLASLPPAILAAYRDPLRVLRVP